MKLIDISVPLDANVPTYPGNTPFQVEAIKRMANGASSNVSTLHMSAHAGTHVDAPRHLYLIPREWFHEFARRRGLKVELDTTRDVGSLALNYYGWYLAVRNLTGRRLPDKIVCRVARVIANRMRSREEREWQGRSYTIALRRP